MRFEEAAGVLAMLANRVASITGYKVSVIAHSFGGVVAHQALMGQGIRYDGADRWVRVPVDGVFQRLITLGSPLSGISDNSNVSLGLTAGRDESDVSIGACPQITCFQAGSTDWDAREVDNFARIIEGLDPERVGMPDSWQGASIRALHDGWTIGAAHSVPFSTVVSLRHRPIADLTPDLTNETAFRLGDGLISLMGQAVIPSDFSESPFASKEELNILDSELGTSFLEDVDGRFGSNLLYRSIGGRDYFFAMRATHTARHFSLESRGQAQFPFKEVNSFGS